MLATELTKQQRKSIRRTHSAMVPAYILRDDGSVMRIWPSGHIDQIGTRRGERICQVKTIRNVGPAPR